ncbi:MAG: SdrD B-like domain-containing protein, partial [Bacteroidia bacterium]
TFTFTNNSNGCSATTTSVAVNANTSSTTTANICLTDMPYVWNGNTYNTAGTYLVNLTNSKGCDSAATLVLNVINATVGNYVWSDLNNNGIQDEPASAGLNGVTVELWNATTNTIVASTVTVNDGSGNPGYYSFNICTNGNYKVKFPTSNNGNGLTIQTPTAGTDGNNDADAATGFSPVFTINTNGTGVAKNNPTIDAGYFVCVKPNAGVDQVVCAASCTNLVGTNLSNGTWTALASNPAGATLGTTTAGIANVCFTTPLNCSFKFIYTVSGGCSDTMTVTVNPLPIQPTCSPITKCIGLNATNAVLAAVTPAGGTITWNTGNAATATGYTYTITNSCGSASCSSSITRVNVTPITGSIITICIGVDATSAVLAGVTPAGGTITWNTGNATTATGYTYTVTSGCGAQNFTSVITRIPLPTTPTCSPITVCVGSNATADVTAAVSPAGGVVTWNTGNATTATSYTYTVSNSCGSASCTNTITRNNPNVAHTAAVTVCAGVDATSAVLPFVSPAGGTITWNTGNASTATSYTYTVPCVCGTQSSTSAITRTALPSVPTCGVVSITEGVNATAAVMAAVSPAGGVITWNTGNATSATSYTYTVSNSCGSASCACTITRTPLCVKPTFSSTVPSYTICAGQPITINVTNAGTLSGSGSSLSLYANNFNSSIGSNWTFPATSPANVPSILSYNGENMLGALQGQKAEFNIAGLPSHNSVKIDFDLYIFDTWDGNDIWVGEDKWKMDVDNTNIINTTFSNFNYRTQAYPGNIPAINPNGSGSIANNLPAICNLGGGAFTSKYHISKTIPHTANALKVVLEGLGLEELCNESWAFDNFNIEYSTTGVTSNVIWTNPPVSSNTISNNASITVSPSSSTYYVADMNGCKDTVRVTVIPTPVTPVCGTVTLCQGLDATSAVLAVVSPAGGVITWNTSSATTATSYTYTVSNSNCTANTNGTINRLSLPATPTCAPVTIGTGVNATAAVMAAVSPAGGVITWNTGNASTATSYTYTVSNSCGTATCACTITRTVDCVKPTFSSTIPSYTICAGQPITINVTNATSTVGAVGSFNAAYSNNFNTSVDGNWTFPATSPANVPSILSYNGESMLGALQGQKAEFNMAGLPAHDSIKVDFDLYLFDTWDGNDTWVGIDRWKMDVDNNSVINTTFSNFSYRTQAYPGNIPAVNPNGTGSIANNLPARCNLGGGAFTSKYHISRTVAHSAASIKVVLEGLGLEELCNESWAFDNFSLQYSGSGSVTTNVTWTNPPVSANTISSSTSITVNPTTSTYYVANMNGCKDTVRVTVLPNPTAPNTAPLIVCNGLDATAAILLATSPQGGVITFNTGNGATATSYTYTITNANNCSASSTNTITRTNSTIAIACAPLTLAAGIDATAAVTAAVSPAGGVIIWNTGNPSTATSYTYSLVACGCGGSSCSNIITRTGISTGTGNASFNTLVSGNCNNYITTTNTSTGTGNTYLWNFGDGSTSNEVSPSHYYIDGGVKTITLTVTNGSSVTTASNDVNISANTGMNGRVGMTVAISPSTTQVLLGNSFAFTPTYTNNSNNSPGLYCAGTPNWTFGDGTSSTGTVIFSKSYAAAGSYTARIIQQTTNTGCFSEVSKVITVTPNPLFAVNNNTPISYKNNYTLNEKNNSLTNVKVATVAIDLYPNPNYGTFKIDLTNTNINNADVIIYDIFGKEVYRNNFNVSNSNIIDIANLDIATGNYNLVISSNGETKARKQFVKIIE